MNNILYNESKGCRLSEHLRLLKTSHEKALGLMFSKEKKDFALIFFFSKDLIISLHMFFVFYPIDVIFLDSEMRIVEIKENFKPFTIYNPKKKARFVIELPKGTIARTKTIVGDLIGYGKQQ